MYCKIIELYRDGNRIDERQLKKALGDRGTLQIKPLKVNGQFHQATLLLGQNLVGRRAPTLPALFDARWERSTKKGFVLRGWQLELHEHGRREIVSTEIVQEWWVIPLPEPKVDVSSQTPMDNIDLAKVVSGNTELLALLSKLRDFAEQAKGAVVEHSPVDADLSEFDDAIDDLDELLASAAEQRHRP